MAISRKKKKRNPVAVFCSLLGTGLLLLIILICVPLVLPEVVGYHVYTVVTGSMEPEIPVGSLIYINEMKPEDVIKGDIIAFFGVKDSTGIITHRVVENRVVTGEFITKGDANRENDMNAVPYQNFIGKEVLCIPVAGSVAQVLTSDRGKFIAAGVIAAAILMHIVSMLINRNQE